MVIICTRCEHEIQGDPKFCSECGYPTPKGTAINAFTPEEHHAMTHAFMAYQRKQHGQPEPEPRPVEQDGVPAITPHLNTDDPSLPTYTAEDAIAFTLEYPQPYHGKPVKEITADDITVEFMPDTVADKLLNNICIGQPPDHVVCVVQTHGPFLEPRNVAHHSRAAIPRGTVQAFYINYTYRVFSRIGHLLVECGSLEPYLPHLK